MTIEECIRTYAPLGTFIVTCLGAYIANKALARQATIGRTQLFQAMLTNLIDQSVRDARYAALEGDLPGLSNYKEIPAEELNSIRKLCTAYDRYCFLALGSGPYRDELLEFQGDEIRLLFPKLEGFIKWLRSKHSRPGHCKNFEAAHKILASKDRK